MSDFLGATHFLMKELLGVDPNGVRKFKKQAYRDQDDAFHNAARQYHVDPQTMKSDHDSKLDRLLGDPIGQENIVKGMKPIPIDNPSFWSTFFPNAFGGRS